MPLNLKLGDWVELRCGKWAQVVEKSPTEYPNKNFPICLNLSINYYTYTKKGKFIGGRQEPLDIIKKIEPDQI